jgi:pimeloyl-ACP methyl ester carboxylesterase
MPAFTRTGSGPRLLLLHGLGGTHDVWAPVIEILAPEREVLAVDMPGFGASAPLEGEPATARNLGRAIAGFCEAQGFERPHIAGNSLGAWVALEMAVAGDAASVTAISPAGLWRKPPGPSPPGRRRKAKALRPLIAAALYTRAGRRAALGRTVARPDAIPAAAARRSVLGWIDSEGYEAADREMRSGRFEPAGFPDIPVTIAWGDRDRMVGPPKPHRMPAGARFVVLEGLGHTPTWDDPRRVAQLLLEGSSGEPRSPDEAGNDPAGGRTGPQ